MRIVGKSGAGVVVFVAEVPSAVISDDKQTAAVPAGNATVADLTVTHFDDWVLDAPEGGTLLVSITAQVPQTLWPSRQLMQTLFTPAEQIALATAAQSSAQVFLFMLFVAATPTIDITLPEFVDDINTVKAAGLITAPRAAQILAGTPAPA